MKRLKTFAAVSLMTGLSACASWTMPVGATNEARAATCQVWGESLPTRSRADTAHTQAEIQAAYADFANACPAFVHLIP